MRHPSRVRAALTVIAVALVALCAACGSGPPPPRLVTSRYETATGYRIVRDCGFSVPLPGSARSSLWLFCDTAVTGRGGREIGYPILGAGTAAEGPYTAGRGPGVLAELATPASSAPASSAPAGDAPGKTGHGLLPARTAPRPFLPVPAGLTLPVSTGPASTGPASAGPASAQPCAGPHTYPARWVTGAAREPGSSGQVLISYADYCVSGPDVFTPEGFGLVGYDPAGNVLGAPGEVFTVPPGGQLPQQRQEVLGSPVFRDGYLYLFGLCGHSCRGRGGVFLARTAAVAASWDNGFSYRYWTGRGWSADLADAAPLTGPATPGGVSAGDYRGTGRGLVMIEQTSVAGDFSVWQAAAPAGPWRETRTGRVPCTPGRPPGLCRALIGHPELSTPDDLLISFFNPGPNHVEVATYPW
jgi:hypothetical protein